MEDVGVFGLFYGHFVYILAFLVYFMVMRYILPRFGMLYQLKSGNPGRTLAPNRPDRRHPRCRNDQLLAKFLRQDLLFLFNCLLH
jgi:hypothetical protein